MTIDDERAPSGQALVNEATAGLHPTGFDPSRETMPPKMARFLANPPARISDEAKRARHARNCRRSLRKSVLQSLFDKQDGICHYCRIQMTLKRKVSKNRATVDHVLPLALGGTNARENLVAACDDCNRRKANLTAEAYAENLAKRARESAVWAKRMAAGLPCKMAGHDENGNRLRRDTDGSGEAGETGTGSTRRATAGAEGIAQGPKPHL